MGRSNPAGVISNLKMSCRRSRRAWKNTRGVGTRRCSGQPRRSCCRTLQLRSARLADSGLFGPRSLGIDGALLLLGIVIAGTWVEQPFAAIIAAAPLVLIYRALHTTNLEVVSHRDPLTGLYNRRHFEESLEQELNRARHQGT